MSRIASATRRIVAVATNLHLSAIRRVVNNAAAAAAQAATLSDVARHTVNEAKAALVAQREVERNAVRTYENLKTAALTEGRSLRRDFSV